VQTLTCVFVHVCVCVCVCVGLRAQTVAVYNDGVDFEALLEKRDTLTCSQLLQDALFVQQVEAGGEPFEKGARCTGCLLWRQHVLNPAHSACLFRFACCVVAVMLAVVWQESRPRFWFVAVAPCNDAIGQTGAAIPLEYELQLLNPGGTFQRQFSKDTQTEFEMFIAGLVFTAILSMVMLVANVAGSAQSSSLGAFASCICMNGCCEVHPCCRFFFLSRCSPCCEGKGVVKGGVGRASRLVLLQTASAFRVLTCCVIAQAGAYALLVANSGAS